MSPRHFTPWSSAALALAAALCGSAAQAAEAEVAALVYSGGEALPPEAEARLRSLQAPADGLTRAEVLQQLADAREAGTLAGHGDMADLPRVLRARMAANQLQERQLLAAYARAQELAQAQEQAQTQRLTQAAAEPAAATAVTADAPAASALAGPVAAAPGAGDATATAPAERPAQESPEDPQPQQPPVLPAAPAAAAQPAPRAAEAEPEVPGDDD